MTAREVEEAMDGEPLKVNFSAREWQMIRDAVSACAFTNEVAGDELHTKLRSLASVGKFHAIVRTK